MSESTVCMIIQDNQKILSFNIDKIIKVFKHLRQSVFLLILQHEFGHMSMTTRRTTMKIYKS